MDNVQQVNENTIKTSGISMDDVIRQVLKIPFVKINRSKFLKKELVKYYPETIINQAIQHNPAYAGIERKHINRIAKKVINYETRRVTTLSLMSGVPGGNKLVVSVSADVIQSFVFILRVIQKLSYLYGFEEFYLNEDKIDPNTMRQLKIFIGIMFGVRGASTSLRVASETVTHKISKSATKAIMNYKTSLPIVDNMTYLVGERMINQIFLKGVSKVIPIAGGIVTGGLTYASFKLYAHKLKNDFKKLDLSDPNYYRQQEN